MGESKRRRQAAAEQEAVHTTIVGGRPPGSGKPLGAIPRGVEVLIKKAAVDPEFRRTLLALRGAAAEEIGLSLTPTEAALLRVAPAQQLEAIIDRTRVAPEIRPAFLGKAAAFMLAALGAASGGAAQVVVAKGVRPVDRPPATQPAPADANAPQEVAGARATRPNFPAAGSMPPAGPGIAPGTRPARPPTSKPVRLPTSGPASRPATSQPAIAEEDFQKMIQGLDADGYKDRDAAQKKLQAAMPGIAPRLEKALKEQKLTPEQKSRIEALLEQVRPVRPSEVQPRNGVRIDVVAGLRLRAAGELAD